MQAIWWGLGATALGVIAFLVYLKLIRPRLVPPYVRNPSFMTAAEKKFFAVLQKLIDDRAYLFVKVRLADILAVKDGVRKYLSHFAKISQKHADFVIADEDLNILCAIELDDSTHEQKERKKRDRFVNRAYAAADVTLIHIPLQKSYTEDDLAAIEACLPEEKP